MMKLQRLTATINYKTPPDGGYPILSATYFGEAACGTVDGWHCVARPVMMFTDKTLQDLLKALKQMGYTHVKYTGDWPQKPKGGKL